LVPQGVGACPRNEVDTHRINAYTWIGAGFAKRLSGIERRGNAMGLEQDLYFISVAARMLGMHPQTLRKYERLGLVQPTRTMGSMRVYSRDELERLRAIKKLVDGARINLAGVQRLLSIAEVVQRIRPLMRDEALSARDARRRLSQELDELSRMLGIE
jgi:MerR family transcriptional regulator/heat shock protein HspR